MTTPTSSTRPKSRGSQPPANKQHSHEGPRWCSASTQQRQLLQTRICDSFRRRRQRRRDCCSWSPRQRSGSQDLAPRMATLQKCLAAAWRPRFVSFRDFASDSTSVCMNFGPSRAANASSRPATSAGRQSRGRSCLTRSRACGHAGDQTVTAPVTCGGVTRWPRQSKRLSRPAADAVEGAAGAAKACRTAE
jgi:hypothetical protein